MISMPINIIVEQNYNTKLHMISTYIDNILHSYANQLVLHVKTKGRALAMYELTITLKETNF